MKYTVILTEEASADLKRLQRNEPSVYKKDLKLIAELGEHPKMGTGHPEPLKGLPEGRWSRQITKKHRLVYRIDNGKVLVIVLASYGHYDDK
jgi:toxin YoeB